MRSRVHTRSSEPSDGRTRLRPPTSTPRPAESRNPPVQRGGDAGHEGGVVAQPPVHVGDALDGESRLPQRAFHAGAHAHRPKHAPRSRILRCRAWRPLSAAVMIENTHNWHGGVPWSVQELQRLSETARSNGLAVHLTAPGSLMPLSPSGRMSGPSRSTATRSPSACPRGSAARPAAYWFHVHAVTFTDRLRCLTS